MLGEVTEWKPDICIYHGGCDDGFTAAWSIWKRWPDCTFVAASHGDPLPAGPALEDKNVLFVDFCPKIEWIDDNWAWYGSVVILDHHKTAEADLTSIIRFDGRVENLNFGDSSREWPRVFAWFDMEQSGAAMAWRFANQYFGPSDLLPSIVQYVEDRDLWRFKLIGTKQFSAALRLEEKTFESWEAIASDVSYYKELGEFAFEIHNKLLRMIAESKYFRTIGGHEVPVANAPYHFSSDLAHRLLETHPTAPFAATWCVDEKGRQRWSLRSDDSRIDVSEIAKMYGGGGHRNASGFECPKGGWII